MKKTFFTFLLSLFSIALFSQDLIVSTANDSISANITKVTKDMVTFQILDNGVLRTRSYPIEHIADIKYGYFEQEKKEVSPMSNFRIGVQGGYSYQTGKVPQTLDMYENYLKKLKSGYHLGVDVSYYITEKLGVGAKVNFVRSTNSQDDVFMYYEDSYISPYLSDKVNIIYVGPTFALRIPDKSKKHAFIANASVGYINYKDKFDSDILSSRTIKGQTVGGSIDAGYDFRVGEGIAIGVQAAWYIGVLSKVKDGNTTITYGKGEKKGVGHLDLTVGIRFLPQ